MGLGTLYIISAPSGAGKTSLVNALVASLNNVDVSVSHTTRAMRQGEHEGKNYYFVDRAYFEKLLAEDVFLEHALVFGNYYGTSGKWVMERLQAGVDVILEIDWQGAEQVRQHLQGTVGIFILPPSQEDLRERLEERARDDAVTIEKRLALASDEMSHYAEYDYLVVNDDFETAVADLKTIIQGRRLLLAPQQVKHAELLKKLLS
jgi:guanylate kinase